MRIARARPPSSSEQAAGSGASDAERSGHGTTCWPRAGARVRAGRLVPANATIVRGVIHKESFVMAWPELLGLSAAGSSAASKPSRRLQARSDGSRQPQPSGQPRSSKEHLHWTKTESPS